MEFKIKRLKLPLIISFILFFAFAIIGLIIPPFSSERLEELIEYFSSQPATWQSILLHNFFLSALSFLGGFLIIIPYLWLPFQSFMVHWTLKSLFTLNPEFSLNFGGIVIYLFEFGHYIFVTSLGIYLSFFIVKNFKKFGFSKKLFKKTVFSSDLLILLGLFLLSSLLLVLGAIIESLFLKPN